MAVTQPSAWPADATLSLHHNSVEFAGEENMLRTRDSMAPSPSTAAPRASTVISGELTPPSTSPALPLPALPLMAPPTAGGVAGLPSEAEVGTSPW